MKILPNDLAAVMECDPSITSEQEAIEFHMGLHVVVLSKNI